MGDIPSTDAADNSGMLARQCDLAREAETRAAKAERELREVRTALTHALNYCESTDGRRGPLMGSSIPAATWRKLHALAAGATKDTP